MKIIKFFFFQFLDYKHFINFYNHKYYYSSFFETQKNKNKFNKI